MGEFRRPLFGWEGARRFVVGREPRRETKRSRGRKLWEVPGYPLRVFVTSLAASPEEIWRDYHQRAGLEPRIEELKSDWAVNGFCRREFFATEAAFLNMLRLFNLRGEFPRARGMSGYRQPASLPVQVFLGGAIWGRTGHRTGRHWSAAGGGLEKRHSRLDNLWPYEIPTSRKLEFQPPAPG